MAAVTTERDVGAGVHTRETVEFARVVNLSDAVFAIAMTLLVLGIEVPDVPAERLGAELASLAPRIAVFFLAFALVANVWWQHHKLFARLAATDRTLVALDLALLGVVALVPFPTGLLGRHPTNRAAVLLFVAAFVALLALFLALVGHAQRAQRWRRPPPPGLFRWVVAGYLVTIAAMLGAGLAAWGSPTAGLVVLATSNLPELALARRAPAGYRDWS
ncbi:TMEM175 family protein [Egicoccus sp. AB-alg2]|uniref:TMEM175 family protein n=1 Tax=Egicoccus sp. AB-alg2 TaxID=3242693 RepID=UPI00359E1D19